MFSIYQLELVSVEYMNELYLIKTNIWTIMNITELRELQTEFELIRKDINSEFKNIEALRKKFVKNYTVDKILNLKLDEYVVGKDDKSTFCNRIENELNQWGNIHGSNAKKFGLYFGVLGNDIERKYRIGKRRFGTDYNKALQEILNSIKELLENMDNTELIKRNPISPMFKGKILSVYFPNDFLNIFAASHLNYFINNLAINNNSKSEIDKQALLLSCKNNDLIMKNWSIYEFSRFLYFSFGNPKDEIKEENLPKELRKFKLKDFPPIETLKFDFVNLKTEEMEEPKKPKKNTGKNKKPDYLGRSKKFKRIGDRGEQIVLRAEKQFLEKNGKQNLAKKINHIAEKDDTVGFDILSFDLSGNEKQIEVKATLSKIGNSKIFLSANELKIAQEKDNYFFYIVYEAGSKKPKIWRIRATELLNDRNIIKEPILYQLNMRTK